MGKYGWNEDNFKRYLWGRGGFARYDILVDPFDGVVIANNVYSLRDAATLPAGTLKRFSDYIFVVYQEACRAARQDQRACQDRLEWIVHTTVSNSNTLAAAEFATGSANYPTWPGNVLPVGLGQAAGMLASPNARGAAFLCGERKNSLMGKKVPVAVYVFNCDGLGAKCLAVQIKDYEPGIFEAAPF